jgi:hypothetical protein
MKHKFMTSTLVALIVSLTVELPVAHAQESIAVEISKKATLIQDGQAVDLQLEIACPVGREVLEAFAYVVQDDNHSNFGSIPLICDGTSHLHTVRAPGFAGGPLFRHGSATGNAFVLLLDRATGRTESGGDTRRIHIKKAH